VMLSVVVAVLIVVARHLHLPTSLPAATTPNSQFSGARSFAVLEQLCSSEASPRNVGSPGSLVTRTILLSTIREINQNITGTTLVKVESTQDEQFQFWSAADNSSGQAYWEVSTQVPVGECVPSTCHSTFGVCNCVMNIIFRLRIASARFDATPRRGTLLLSAHYDGVPRTQAATDDGTGVAGTF
jgi:hypothetical protein